MATTQIVRRGDTFSKIASQRRVSQQALRRANPQVRDPNKLSIGQKLNIPGARDSFETPAASRRRETAARVAGTDAGAKTKGKDRTGTSPYPNGRIPSKALTDVGGGHKLYGTAATRYKQMRDAAARDGIKLKLTDSYRSYGAQVDLARRKGLYSKGGLAATPGRSNHGLGKAVDVNLKTSSPGAHAWLQKNARRFGFKTIPREPWHWEYKGK